MVKPHGRLALGDFRYGAPVDADAVAPLARILQLSITPVALISGVGLLLLSMTNRLGRVIDRARHLAQLSPADQDTGAELRVLYRRARLLQGAIALRRWTRLWSCVVDRNEGVPPPK